MKQYVFVIVGAALALACSDSEITTGGGTSTGTASGTATGSGGMGVGGEGSWLIEEGVGTCNASLFEPPVPNSPHVEQCSDIDYISEPPTGGPHYGRWANWAIYDEVVPDGYLVHAMEHGGVVFFHQCDGCDLVTELSDLAATLPIDNACLPAADRRVIIAPRPQLDVPFAMAAWGFFLKADCLDSAHITQEYDARYAKGPEDLCAAGVNPFDAEYLCQ